MERKVRLAATAIVVFIALYVLLQRFLVQYVGVHILPMPWWVDIILEPSILAVALFFLFGVFLVIPAHVTLLTEFERTSNLSLRYGTILLCSCVSFLGLLPFWALWVGISYPPSLLGILWYFIIIGVLGASLKLSKMRMQSPVGVVRVSLVGYFVAIVLFTYFRPDFFLRGFVNAIGDVIERIAFAMGYDVRVYW